jgi:general secretion pathway protein G
MQLWLSTKILIRKKEVPEHEKGWSFVEIIVSIVIILVLSGTVGFLAVNQVEKAKLASARRQISSFKLVLDSYYLDAGQYPTKEQGLEALVSKPSSDPVPANWGGPYLDKIEIPLDPWNTEYIYEVPGPNGLPFEVISYGADKLPGGDGRNADIRSSQN